MPLASFWSHLVPTWWTHIPLGGNLVDIYIPLGGNFVDMSYICHLVPTWWTHIYATWRTYVIWCQLGDSYMPLGGTRHRLGGHICHLVAVFYCVTSVRHQPSNQSPPLRRHNIPLCLLCHICSQRHLVQFFIVDILL